MTKLWIAGALVAAIMALVLSLAVAVVPIGVTVFTGLVTINGAAAPAGTTVNVTLQSSGAVIGTGTTGAVFPDGALAANQYRLDIQATSALEGQTVNLTVPGTSQSTPTTPVLNANVVRNRDIVATTTGGVAVPMATALPASFNNATVLNCVFGFDTAGSPSLSFCPGALSNSLTAFVRGDAFEILTRQNANGITIGSVTYNFTANTPRFIGFNP